MSPTQSISHKLLTLILAMLFCFGAVGQDLLIQGNVEVAVTANSLLYVPGNVNFQGAQEVQVTGSLQIGRHLLHNGSGEFIDRQGTSNQLPTGAEVRFVGNGVQEIRSTSGKTAIYLPRLVVDKGQGELRLKMAVHTDLGITMDAGNSGVNNGDLNIGNQTVTFFNPLQNRSSVVGETPRIRIYGDGGRITLNDAGTYLPRTEHNPAGLGFRFTPGTDSPSQFSSISRVHTSISDVADGSMGRYYEISGANGAGNLTRVSFEFAEEERNGIGALDLAIYNAPLGGNWNRNLATESAPANQFRRANVSVLSLGANDRIALAEAVCEANLPQYNITMNVTGTTDPSGTGDFTGAAVNVCKLSDFSLGVPDVYPFYTWTKDNASFGVNASIAETAIGQNDPPNTVHNYRVEVVNQRGCRDTRSMQVNVRSNPISTFQMEPEWIQGVRICKDQEIEFRYDGTGFADDGSLIDQYQWQFDSRFESEGMAYRLAGAMNTTGGPPLSHRVVTHTYNELDGNENTYFPDLTVRTEYGCQSQAHVDTTKILDPPMLRFDILAEEGGALLEGMPPDTCEMCPVYFESWVDFEDNTPLLLDVNPPVSEIGTPLERDLDYLWSFGDGVVDDDPILAQTITQNSTQLDISRTDRTYLHELAQSGAPPGSEYDVTLQVDLREGIEAYSCAVGTTQPIVIHPQPEVLFDMRVDGQVLPTRTVATQAFFEVCQGVPVAFQNLSGIDEGTMTYLWNFGDGTPGSSSTATSPVHEFAQHSYAQEDSVYWVTLQATSDQGCVRDTTIAVRVYPAPTGDISMSPGSATMVEVCVNEPIDFINETFLLEPDFIQSYTWDFGDQEESPLAEPTHSYERPGSYTVELTRRSNRGCENKANELSVRVNSYPEPDFEVLPGCEGEPIHFFDLSQTSGDDVGYEWDFGDQVTSTDPDPLKVYDDIAWASGESFRDFDVELTVTNNQSTSACALAVTKEVRVYRNPTFDFDAAIISFSEDTLLSPWALINSYFPDGTTFEWRDLSGNVLASNPSGSITIRQTAKYVVEALSMAGCSQIDTISVFLVPPVDLGADRPVCESGGLSAAPPLSSPLRPIEYRWFDSEGETVGSEADFLVTSSGRYRVEVVYQSLGVRRSTGDEVTVTVEDDIVLNVPKLIEACRGTPVVLDAGINLSSEGSYTWSGPPLFAPSTERVVETTVAGEYLLTVMEQACRDTASITVRFLDTPNASIALNASTLCEGDVLEATTNAFGYNVSWDFGNSRVSGEEDNLVTYRSAGDYNIQLAITNEEGCTGTDEVTIEVNPVPNVGIIAPGEVCAGSLFNMGATVSIEDASLLDYSWNLGDGGEAATHADVTLQVFEAGTRTIDLTVEATNGCSTTESVDVVINPVPQLQLQIPVLSCEGPVTLDLNDLNTGSPWPSNTSFSWMDEEGLEIGSSPVQLIAETGNYTVSLLSGSCEQVIAVPVYVTNALNLGPDLAVCGDTELSDPTPLPSDVTASFQWFENNLERAEKTESLTVDEDGTYRLQRTLAVGDVQCSSSDEISVDVHEPIAFDIEPLVDLCPGTSTLLDAGEGFDSYTWRREGFTLGSNRSLEVESPGPYELELRRGVCVDQLGIEVRSIALPPVQLLSSETAVCLGSSISFGYSGSSSFLANDWDFGDGSASSATSFEKTYELPGDYQVKLQLETIDGCTILLEQLITVFDVPSGDFAIEGSCEGEEFVFTPRLNQDPMDFSFGWLVDGELVSDESQFTQTFREAGTYEIRMTGVNSITGCEISHLERLEVLPVPVIDFPAQSTTCIDQIELFGPEAADTFSWSDANTGDILGNQPSLTVNTDRTIRLSATAANGCSAEETTQVVLDGTFEIDLGPDIAACGERILGVGNLPGAQFNWSTGDNQSTITVMASGEYAVEVVDSNGCDARDTIFVTIEEPPLLDLGEDLSSCGEESLTLDIEGVAGEILWSTGATTPTINVHESGFYSVQVTKGVCVVSDQVQVQLNAQPSAVFDVLPGCEGESLSIGNGSTIADGGTLDYLWSFDDGSTSTAATPLKVYDNPDTYEVMLTVTSAANCSSSITKTVDVRPSPSASFSFAGQCAEEAIVFSDETTYSGDSELFYTWTLGNAATSNAPTPQYLLEEGDHVVSLMVTTEDGCESSFTNVVTVYPTPKLDLGPDITACGDEYILVAPNATTYLWSDGSTTSSLLVQSTGSYSLQVGTDQGCIATDEIEVEIVDFPSIDLGPDVQVCDAYELNGAIDGATFYAWSSGATSSHIVARETGVYKLFASDDNGCTATDEVFIEVSASPTFDLGDDVEICEGETMELDAGPSSGSYLWSNGQVTQTIEIASSGTYEVTITEGICSVTQDVVVTQLDKPSASFAVDPICEGEDAQFTFEGSEEAKIFIWSFGDGTASNDEDSEHFFGTEGSYDVQLTVVDDNGCDATEQTTLVVHQVPETDFSFRDFCEDQPVTLTASTNFGEEDELAFEWLLGDGGTADEDEVVHVFDEEGIYFTRLNVTTQAGCIGTRVRPLQIAASPQLDLGGNINTCQPLVLLDAGNDGSTFLWSDNSVGQTLEVTKSGSFSVSVTTSDGCQTSESVTVNLLQSEQPDLGGDFANCGPRLLDPGIPGATYLWSTGETSSTIIATNTGAYYVEVLSSDLCSATDTVNATIHAVPVFDLGEDRVACEGESVLLETDTEGAYLWSTSETATSIAIRDTGTISLLVETDEGCTFSDTVNVLFNPLPVIPFDDAFTACDELTLDAGDDGVAYLWSNNATSSSIRVRESGSFWVEVTTDQGCLDRDTTFVDIFSSPTVDLGPDVEVCSGSVPILDAGSANQRLDIIWNTGANTRTIAVGATGTYWVEVRSPAGCVSRDSIDVTIRNPRGLELGEDIVFCEFGPIELDALIEGVSYEWGGSTGQIGDDRTFTPQDLGMYWVEIRDDLSCTERDTIQVLATTEQIEASFLIPSQVVVGDLIHLIPLTDPIADSYLWDFGDGNGVSTVSPIYQYSLPGTYEITLTVSNGTCDHSLSKLIEVQPAGSRLDGFESDVARFVDILDAVLYPNPTHERLTVKVALSEEASTEIRIFDERGREIFKHQYLIHDNALDFDLAGLRSGSYLVSIQAGKSKQLKRFVKINR